MLSLSDVSVTCTPNIPYPKVITLFDLTLHRYERYTLGMSGFHFGRWGGGGGVNRAPKNWGGGFREKGSIDRHH